MFIKITLIPGSAGSFFQSGTALTGSLNISATKTQGECEVDATTVIMLFIN